MIPDTVPQQSFPLRNDKHPKEVNYINLVSFHTNGCIAEKQIPGENKKDNIVLQELSWSSAGVQAEPEGEHFQLQALTHVFLAINGAFSTLLTLYF